MFLSLSTILLANPLKKYFILMGLANLNIGILTFHLLTHMEFRAPLGFLYKKKIQKGVIHNSCKVIKLQKSNSPFFHSV